MKAVKIVSLALGFIFPALAIETVPVLDVEKYTGRWYQLYGNEFTARITRDGTCVAADYGLDQATGNITVINSSRIHSPTGELNTITGYAYGTDPSTPGQLKVHLGQVPRDGDYWVVGLGPDTFGPDGLYEWAIVSGPDAESLFVLVRDVPDFERRYARDVLALVVDLGFTGRSKEPQRVVQEGCLPFHPTEHAAAQKDKFEWADILATVKMDEEDESAYSSDEDVDESGALPEVLGVLSKMLQDGEHYAWTPDFSPVTPVTKLDIGRYLGRWYQVYSSLTVNVLLGQEAACVTADYRIDKRARNVACVNTARMGGPDGELAEIDGYAYVEDKTKPGELTVHLDGVEAEAPYWIVALGNEDGNGPYTYTIVSDPLRAFLFVLVRDPENFAGSQAETEILAKCKELGFTSPWNSPRKTAQAGCSYPEATKIIAHHDMSDALSPVLNLRGGGFGCLPPLHASCKMTFKFSENSCAEVSDALVSSAESMMGFDSCNGGNKCGYTVGKVTDGSVELVHETSVKHYKDSLTFTLTDKGDSCEAAAFSTSQTTLAVLDNSVNYCNLHNLVDASGLEYAEKDVSDCSCTQYSSADCERY